MQNLFEDNIFNEVLEKLDFSIGNDIENSFPEIIFVKNPPLNLHPKHYLYLEFAEMLEADAVFFRYYDDNRYCVPQVYFYDNNITSRDKQQIAEIHKKVYSSCQVPMLCVVDDVHISLFDCRLPVETKNVGISNEKTLFKREKISNIGVLKKYFSAKALKFGLFWESDEASKHFLNNKSAYEKLVQVLTDIRNNFIKVFVKGNISKDFADDLLFKCILIKYLEENGKDGNNDYAKDFYKRNNIEFDSLKDILINKQILALLESLEKHFNGGVFDLAENEKELLRTLDLSSLAEHLEGQLNNGAQLSLWKIYSFKNIPIELISNFYEEFIPKNEENKGTVYTPSFLVNLLIDECLPLNKDQTDFNIKLIDVSCGSGIFISSAFKRLVQRWRIYEGKDGKPLEKSKIKLKDVNDILSKNIYGVDKNKTAVKLSKFSLQLALCQIVPNNELWNWSEEGIFETVFYDLNNNILENDFFDFLIDKKELHNSFDLIIGNPPFEALSDQTFKDYANKLKDTFNFSVKIPDNQLALMFLEASSKLLKPEGNLCFVQKSTSLLYNNRATEFRNSLFNQFHVYQIIDFTLLKNVLFKSKNNDVLDENHNVILDKTGRPKKNKTTSVESCAVFYKKETISDYTTLHIISRLLKSTKDGLFFEFDYYDFNEILKTDIINNDTNWRCNLLGGNRLNYLIKRLNKKNDLQTNLNDYLINHLSVDENVYCEGFIKGTPQGEKDGVNFNCDYIVKKPILTAKNFEKTIFDNFNETQNFYRAPIEKAFLKPLITIKEQISNSKLLIRYDNIDLAYDSRIVGISLNNVATERNLFDILKQNERINALKTLATCSQFFLGSSSVIQKADIDDWVIPLKDDKIKLSDDEKIIVDDVLNYIYPSWYEGEKSVMNSNFASINDLKKFSEVFNKSFNAVYKKDKKEQQLKRIIQGNDFYALEFYYGSQNFETKESNDDEELDTLLKNQISKNGVINRVMKIYDDNLITLIKPKVLRYWLKSIALRDADDVFDDIIEKGLE